MTELPSIRHEEYYHQQQTPRFLQTTFNQTPRHIDLPMLNFTPSEQPKDQTIQKIQRHSNDLEITKEKENKWLKRRNESDHNFFDNLKPIRNDSSCKSPREAQKTDAAETFFVPLTPKREQKSKVTSKEIQETAPSLRREPTKMREKFQSSKQKAEVRQSKGGTVYFVPLSKTTSKDNDTSNSLPRDQNNNLPQSGHNSATNERLKMLNKIDNCFFCGRSVNLYNSDFHNEARCQRIQREKTFTIHKSNRTSSDNPLNLNRSYNFGAPNSSFNFDGRPSSQAQYAIGEIPPPLRSNRSNTNPSNLNQSSFPTGSQLDLEKSACRFCSKPVTRWTSSYHNSRMCQENEMARQKTMMILRNPDSSIGDGDTETLQQWCPEGVRNSIELESLRNLMQPPVMKRGKNCENCGKWFGTKSLPIHMSTCRLRSFFAN